MDPQTKKPPKQNDGSNNKSGRVPTNKSTFWGRGASEYRPGLFTKQYLVKHGEACATDIYQALSEEIGRMNMERIEIGEKAIRRPNYSSFVRYMHWFAILKLIERTGKTEPASYSFLKQRVFYRLTKEGKSKIKPWADPVMAAHPEFR